MENILEKVECYWDNRSAEYSE
ncbi:MAG: hypothetical protein PWP62_2522, partial [Eubacteriaceae bacterium]|nr:hypothetical protein [Eubacteriaceae bacterium]